MVSNYLLLFTYLFSILSFIFLDVSRIFWDILVFAFCTILSPPKSVGYQMVLRIASLLTPKIGYSLINLFLKIDLYILTFSSYALSLVIFNVVLFLSVYTCDLFLFITCLSCFISIYINIYINYINLSLKNNKPGLYRLLNIGTQIVIITSFYIFSHYLLKILLELFNILKVKIWDSGKQGPPPTRNRPDGPSGPPGGDPQNNTNVLSPKQKRKNRKNANQKRYSHSAKGQATGKKYRESEKVKQKHQESQVRYSKSKKGQATADAYYKSEHAKELHRENERKRRQTEEGKNYQKDYENRPERKERKKIARNEDYNMQTKIFSDECDRSKGIIAVDEQGEAVHYKSLNSFCTKYGTNKLSALKAINLGGTINGYTLHGIPKTDT